MVVERVQIIVPATEVGRGAFVTGYAIAVDRPTTVTACTPTALTRLYRGFGSLRAETGPSPRRGFGQAIGGAHVTQVQLNQGIRLWLRVLD